MEHRSSGARRRRSGQLNRCLRLIARRLTVFCSSHCQSCHYWRQLTLKSTWCSIGNCRKTRNKKKKQKLHSLRNSHLKFHRLNGIIISTQRERDRSSKYIVDYVKAITDWLIAWLVVTNLLIIALASFHFHSLYLLFTHFKLEYHFLYLSMHLYSSVAAQVCLIAR